MDAKLVGAAGHGAKKDAGAIGIGGAVEHTVEGAGALPFIVIDFLAGPVGPIDDQGEINRAFIGFDCPFEQCGVFLPHTAVHELPHDGAVSGFIEGNDH